MSENVNPNMTLYEKVRSVPTEALKEIKGGRLKGMSDINPMWRIKMLTEMFGMCGIGWKIEIVDKRIEKGTATDIVCFVDINLFVKSDNEWSAAIPGMGGSSFVTLENSGKPYTSDECFKMAYTDAISVACKTLGFAADVYYANDRTKYTNQEDDKKPHEPSTTTNKSTQTNTPTNTQNGSTGQSGTTTLSPTMRVYKIREELGWEWKDLNNFASDVLQREVKYLKNDVKTAEEWIEIEKALLITKTNLEKEAS